MDTAEHGLVKAPLTGEIALALARWYGFDPASVVPLAAESGKLLLREELPDGTHWVIHGYPSSDGDAPNDRLTALVAVLSALAQAGYPAERVRPAADGEMVAFEKSWHFVVTSFLPGDPPEPSVENLRALGARLGQLHSLSISANPVAVCEIPPAEMLPRSELAYALAQLQDVASRVPPHLREEHAAVVQLVSRLDRCEGLPPVLIHNDCHPGNARRATDGQVTFIDWDGAGWGPAVVDLGFLLASADGRAPSADAEPSKREQIEAVIDGYVQHHRLTPEELAHLPDAIRFRAVVFGAVSLAAAVRDGRLIPQNQSWRRRVSEADTITAWARERFAVS